MISTPEHKNLKFLIMLVVTKKTILAFIAATVSLTAVAQVKNSQSTVKESTDERISLGLDPMLCLGKEMTGSSGYQSTSRPTKLLKTGSGAELWVNVTYAPGMSKATDRSISSCNTNSPSNLTPLIKGNFMFYNGIGLVDGKIYAGFNSRNSSGTYSPILYTIDTESWTVLSTEMMNNYALMAFETAQADDGTTYGEFYSADGKSREIGIVDYPNKKRSTLFKSSKTYCALGITKDGVLYGVASDGYLYRIDKQSGNETKVGPTGVTVSDDKGTFFFQTGEIDQTDDTFYWLGTDQTTQSTSLYTVNLGTGAATKLHELGKYTFSGMLIRRPAAKDGAPAEVTDLSVMFQDESTNGAVVFTAPMKTFGGDAISGSLNWEVFIDGTSIGSGSFNPGDNQTVPVSVSEGMHTFDVVVSNAVGSSPTARLKKWIGYDVPEPASNIVLELDKASGNAFLYWEAPGKSLNNGYMGGVIYDVYRISDGKEVKVAENFTDTYFEEQLTVGELTNYTYAVVAINGTQRSKRSFSNSERLGNAFTVPYFEDFDNKDKFGIWTVIDVAGDRSESNFGTRGAWVHDSKSHSASYTFGEIVADDWLISPPVRLQTGKSYSFTLRAKARAGTSKVYPEKFEVKMGKGASVESMTTEIVPETELKSATYTVFSNNSITVNTDGEYNFGVHALSTRDGWTLYIDSVMVEVNATATSPDSVTNLSVKADASGELRTDVSFKAPTRTAGGTNLTEKITKIELRRDNRIIETFADVVPGTNLTYQDLNVELGRHTYALLPFAGDEQGVKHEKSVYVGVDVPDYAHNIKIADGGSNIQLSWEKVGTVGSNGGLVIPENVDYLVWNTAIYNGTRLLYQKLDSVRNDNQSTVVFNTDSGEQGEMFWAVQPKNIAGAGEAHMSGLLVGKPYELPFKETLTKGSITKYWKFNGTGSGMTMKISADASDGDGYAFEINSPTDTEYGELYSGKISLSAAAHPTLTFDVKGTSSGNTVGIYVVKPDGSETMVGVVNPSTDYRTYQIDLSAYSNERYIRIGLFESFDTAGKLVFDNINITDMLENNLKVLSFNAPATVKAGESADVRLVMKNYGKLDASNYKVKISAGDMILVDKEFSDRLEPMNEKIIEAKMPTTIFTAAGEVNLKAEIIYQADENKSDNSADRIIEVVASQAARPENLTLETKSDGIQMNWKAPKETTTVITEDFENTGTFEPFSLGGITGTKHEGAFGQWTLIDGDAQTTSAWGAVTYPNSAKPHAWQVINPRSVFGANMYDGDKAHSGEQYLISFCPVTGAADDWLISPELPGVEQTATFFVKCLSNMYGDETYEVLYSLTDNRRKSFTQIGSTVTATMEWTEKTVHLPAGTKYFAIRHTATDAFGLLVDDISYSVRGGSVEKYNVYFDKNHLATVSNNSTSHLVHGPIAAGDHLFSVTAVYADGIESAPVSESLIVTGINLPRLSDASFDVYTIDGKLVRRAASTLSGLHGVYIVNGKKQIIM